MDGHKERLMELYRQEKELYHDMLKVSQQESEILKLTSKNRMQLYMDQLAKKREIMERINLVDQEAQTIRGQMSGPQATMINDEVTAEMKDIGQVIETILSIDKRNEQTLTQQVQEQNNSLKRVQAGKKIHQAYASQMNISGRKK